LIPASAFLSGAEGDDGEHVGDRLDDEAGGDRGAVIVQDRHQGRAGSISPLDRQQAAHLRIAVLLDDETLMVGDESSTSSWNGSADAQRVEMDAAGSSAFERLFIAGVVEPK